MSGYEESVCMGGPDLSFLNGYLGTVLYRMVPVVYEVIWDKQPNCWTPEPPKNKANKGVFENGCDIY